MDNRWSLGVRQTCMFCLAKDAMSFRLTKKGGAFLTCAACGSRAFLHGQGTRGPEALFGAMSLALSDNNVEAARQILAAAASVEGVASGR